MDVAGQLVVMNEGRVEQSGSADELYEQPANEFVMSFVGEVNRLGEHYVRPHDMEVVLDARRRHRGGDGAADRRPRLRDPGRVRARRRHRGLGAADPRRAAAAGAARGPDRLPAARAGQELQRFVPSHSPGPRLPMDLRMVATQRYLQPSEEARGGVRFAGWRPAPIRHQARRRSNVFTSFCSSSLPATVLSRRAVARAAVEAQRRHLVVEAGALEEAPADARVGCAGRRASPWVTLVKVGEKPALPPALALSSGFR